MQDWSTYVRFFSKHRVKIFWFIVALSVFTLIFSFRFQAVPTAFSTGEQTNLTSSHSLKTILDNPVNAPYKLLVWLPFKMGIKGLAITRVAASIFGAMVLCIFFLILKQRYSLRQAIFGTAIFASSGLFLHAARLGSPDILQAAMLMPFVMPLLWYQKRLPRSLIVYCTIILCAICLYIPGFLWVGLAGVLAYRRQIVAFIKAMDNKHLIISTLLSVILVFPLFWSSLSDLGIWRDLFGLPSSLPSPAQLVSNVYHSFESLIFKSSLSAEHTLIGAPILTSIEIILVLFGAYNLWKKPRLATTYYISGLLLLAIMLNSLGGSISLFMAAPFIYMFISAGIYFLLQEWLTVFPRNPVAKHFAVVVMVLLVATSITFQLRSYFVAWPHNQHTKDIFTVEKL